MSEIPISKSDFAKERGVDEKLIRRAIEQGKITSASIVRKGKRDMIISSLAHKECDQNGVGTTKKNINAENQQAIAPKIERYTDEEEEEAIAGLNGESTYATAQRANMIFKAQKAYLELEEYRGTLQNKDEIYKEMFDFGVEIKNEFLLIPDRITDELMSITDRKTFYNRLKKEITDSLIKLNKLGYED